MKKYIFALFFISVSSISQTIKVDYVENRIVSKERLEQTPEFARAEILKKKYFRLLNSNGTSIYSFVSSDKVDSLKTDVNEEFSEDRKVITTSIYKIAQTTSDDFYYKDFADQTLIFRMFNGGVNFDGKDKFIDWNWTITNETQLINGFTCKKATSNSLGITFTAWFTDDIPVSDGPGKFTGLSGLILHVGNPYYEWNATRIKIEKEKTLIERPKEVQHTYTLQGVNDYLSRHPMSIPGTVTKTEGNSTITTTTTVIKD